MIRRLLTLLIPLLILAGGMIGLAQPASALPGVSDCKDAPVPQRPGSGMSGWIDPGPVSPDPAATSVYESVGYPPQWHTYDLGCGGGVRDPWASIDTGVGNWLMGCATVTVAFTNSLHRMVSPPVFLNKLDPLVAKTSATLHDALFTPWIGLSILLLAIVIIWSARRKNLPHALAVFAWAILVLTVATALFSYPTQASHFADDVATSTVGQVNSSMLGEDPNEADPSTARAALLTDNVLYRQWLRGELGSSDWTTAVKYGRQLLASQKYSYAETQLLDANPGAATTLNMIKQAQFKDIAGKIHDEDPDAYEHLKGQSGSRIGTGFIAIMAALCTCPFLIMASLLIVIGLLLIRMIIIFGPVIAIIAVHHSMRKIGVMAFTVAVAALINCIGFAIGAAVQMLAIGVILGSNTGLPGWFTFILALAFSVILWGLMKPLRRLTSMVSAGDMKSSAVEAATMSKARKTLRTVGSVALGVGIGNKIAEEVSDKPGKAAPATAAATEDFTRPETATQRTIKFGQQVRDVTNERSKQQPPEATPQTATPSVEPAPGRAAVSNPPPEQGSVAEPDFEYMHRAEPIIDGEAVVYRIWDADSKSYVNMDDPTSEGGEQQ